MAGFNFDNYIKAQTDLIVKRSKKFSKLYLEFGGKLFDDNHAARVLPGYDANGKISLLKRLKDKVEVLMCINAKDIQANKIRADLGITYDLDCLRLIDSIRAKGILVSGIIITQYTGQPAADSFRKRLKRRGEKVYTYQLIQGYPTNIDLIVSSNGYGANPFIETIKPIVVLTGPGPGSGKMAAALCQMYHEYKRGNKAGFAKFETFPVWNLQLSHPVNLAYEAATADLGDINSFDPFHLEAYGEIAVNYNRDIEVFPIVKNILYKITGGEKVYQSPTDMGVNTVGDFIDDEVVVKEAAKQEIVRRYYKTKCDYREGRVELSAVERIEIIMKKLGIDELYGKAVAPALEKAKLSKSQAVALVLKDGKVVTGRATEVLGAAASLVLNCVKILAGIPDDIHLISPNVIRPMQALKEQILCQKDKLLGLEDVLNALSICAATDPGAEKCLKKLHDLKGCVAHSSHMLKTQDELALKKLGIVITCTPEFASADLYTG